MSDTQADPQYAPVAMTAEGEVDAALASLRTDEAMERAVAELRHWNVEAVAGFRAEDVRGVTEKVIAAYFGDAT